MSEPVPMNEAVRLFLQQMTGVTLPEPCPRCGWQYDDDVLVEAARKQVVLDPQPTHLCRPARCYREFCNQRATEAVSDHGQNAPFTAYSGRWGFCPEHAPAR